MRLLYLCFHPSRSEEWKVNINRIPSSKYKTFDLTSISRSEFIVKQHLFNRAMLYIYKTTYPTLHLSTLLILISIPVFMYL